MPSLTIVGHADSPQSADYSHIVDLALVTTGDETLLISATRYDGVLQLWDLSGAGLTADAALPYPGADLPGSTGGIAALTFGAETVLLTGGGTGGTLQTIALNSDGSFGASTALDTLPSALAGFQNTAQLTMASGNTLIAGGAAGGAGLYTLQFDASGALVGQQTINGPATSQIAATATTTIGSASYVLSLSAATNELATYAVGTDGTLAIADIIDPDAGLWISAPTVLKTVQVGETTYAILGAAGTDSLTVLEIGSDGTLTVRDHVLDDRGTRFGGITALEIVEHQGKTYVIAGGADDGLSVFLLLEGGFLVHRAHIADTDDISLANVSAIVAQSTGTGLAIYAASSSETGVTMTRFDAGLPGVTLTAALGGGLLTGTAGTDVLQGHDGADEISAGAGDDVLRDGAGSDTLTGGAGADVFILSADGAIDTITDFTLGEDKIDLSLWPLLRDISQLFISLRPDGMLITYGTETLIVQSADGLPIDYRDLTNDDVIGLARIPIGITPGYPGPATPPPGTDPAPPPAAGGGPHSIMATTAQVAAGNAATIRAGLDGAIDPAPPAGVVLQGTAAADVLAGADSFDLIFGGGGDDTLDGMSGGDVLFGEAGADLIDGGAGSDTLFGGQGNDALRGGDGQDYLDGGRGDDVLAGDAGDDVLWGRAGADEFIIFAGHDVIADFEQGVDRIVLDARLWTGLTSAADVLFFYGSYAEGRMTITFSGDDVLHIDGVTDPATLANDIMLF